MGARVAVAGAGGYAGGELLRLLAAHPDLEVVTVCGNEQAGQPLARIHPQLASLAGMTLAPTRPELLADVDLVFLALPAGKSGSLAAAIPPGVRIVDLGADHRLDDPAAWAAHYGGPHAGTWTYGLPELPGQRDAVARAGRVAAAGCYATAIILALAPLIAAGLADPADIVVVAASGTSGAGRVARPHLLGSEVMGDLSPYRVGSHQHVPEIRQASGARSLSFTPILAPMPRGILATVTARPLGPGSHGTGGAGSHGTGGGDSYGIGGAAREALGGAYRDAPFVRLLPEDLWPHTAATLGSNTCLVQVGVDGDSGRLIVTSALDNLGKGAAGQAVQCANLMLGLPETTGLSIDGMAP